jgi:integrase/recombinase XerD
MNELNSDIEWFLDHCANHRKLSSHTLKAYRHDLSKFKAFTIENAAATPIALVVRNLIQHWLGSMKIERPRTVRRRLAKSMFASLERHGRTANNPLAGLRCEVKVGNILPRTIARGTVKSLLLSPRRQPVGSPVANERIIQEIALWPCLDLVDKRWVIV